MPLRRPILALAATLAFAGPAVADWSYGSGTARAAEGDRTLIVSCDDNARARVSLVPGPRRLEQETNLLFGFVVDGGARTDVPFQCSAASCAELVAPRNYTLAQATALISRLKSGSTLQILFRDRAIETFSLRGSSAAIASLARANPACRGL